MLVDQILEVDLQFGELAVTETTIFILIIQTLCKGIIYFQEVGNGFNLCKGS